MAKKTASFTVEDWKETQVSGQTDGLPRVMRADVKKNYSGAMKGASQLTYIVTYRDNGTAHFVGQEWFEGEIAGKSGSLVLEHVGDFVEGTAMGRVNSVDGSGRADLISSALAFNFAASGRETQIEFEV